MSSIISAAAGIGGGAVVAALAIGWQDRRWWLQQWRLAHPACTSTAIEVKT